MPPAFQQHIDKTLKNETPAWLEDVIIVTRGTADTHECMVEQTMNNRKTKGTKQVNGKRNYFKKKANHLDT